jgi:hypothetical protein
MSQRFCVVDDESKAKAIQDIRDCVEKDGSTRLILHLGDYSPLASLIEERNLLQTLQEEFKLKPDGIGRYIISPLPGATSAKKRRLARTPATEAIRMGREKKTVAVASPPPSTLKKSEPKKRKWRHSLDVKEK